MYSRWYNIAVVLLWMAAMTWLTVVKVLPPLLIGERPSYNTILEARMREPPVAWELLLDGQKLGWALCTIDELPHELTEIRSRVHFDRLPLEPVRHIVPEWLTGAMGPLERSMGGLEMDTESMVIIDPLGRLSQVESAIWFDPRKDAIRMRGTVEGNRLNVEVRAGGEKIGGQEVPLTPDALLGDALSPQTQLPQLRIGQKWTVPTYSLLGPVEVLTARVERMERIFWAGDSVETWLVAYRNEDGSGLEEEDSLRGRLWVRLDGTVLKQEMRLFSAPMTFVRLPDDAARRLEDRVEQKDRGRYIWRSRPSRSDSFDRRGGGRKDRPSPQSPAPLGRPRRPANTQP